MRSLLTLLALPLFLIACSDSVDEQLQGSPTSGFVALFDPGSAVIPFPSSLLFSGSLDGTLNIPLSGTASDGPRIAMNTLDGFSTVAPMSTGFSEAIDAATVPGAVRVFEATALANTAITSIVTELTFGIDFIATVSSVDLTGQTLAILPLKPLKPITTYVVVINKSLLSTDGRSAGASQVFTSAQIPSPVWDGTQSLFASFDDATAERLEPLRQLMVAQSAALDAFEAGLSAQMALAWNFKTQSISDVLAVARSLASGASAINPTSIGNTGQLNPALSGKADVYVGGLLAIPYYSSAPSTANPIAPLTDFWLSATAAPSPPFAVTEDKFLTQFNPVPNKTTDVNVPLLVSIPNATSAGGAGGKPGAGWPVLIFQHGITGDRTNMLAIADGLADAGFAVVAIDMPLHGLSPDNPLHDSVNGERTFNVDYVTQDENGSIIASAPDGVVDSSGRHFINLSSTLTSRDNIRQAVADLFALTVALGSMDYDGGGADFDATRIHFIGHSLGAMVGGVFLALETNVKSSVLAMPGGGIAKLLDGSPTFGPEIAAGLLAQAGLSKGTSDFEGFMAATQTAIDSADPINYASSTNPAYTGNGRGILMFEIVGSDGSLPDQVVPNHVGTLANGFQDAPSGTVPGPLSGTDPLAAQMGLMQISATSPGNTNPQHLVRFTEGDHRSILSPASSLAVTVEMQTQAATFIATDGSTTLITNGAVVAPAP